MRSYATDHRTPLAWRHRDMTLHDHLHPRRPTSPTVTTSSSEEREEVPMVRRRQFSPYPPYRGGGTLRSTRSVPTLALATWDGEPCPVHGHGIPHFHVQRHGSLFDLRPPPPLMDKSLHGSMQMLGPLPWLAPPLMRPRPYVIPASMEPLPVRDPFRQPSKMVNESDYNEVCCKGHLIVLWVILAVVTIGVILGIVLGVTIA